MTNQYDVDMIQCLRPSLYTKWFFVLFIMVFFSKDTLLFGTNANQIVLNIGYIFYLLLAIYLIFQIGGKIERYSVNMCIAICVMSVIGLLFDPQQSVKYFYEIMIVVMAYVYTRKCSIEKFKLMYVDIIYVLSLISIIAFFLCSYIYFPHFDVLNKVNIRFSTIFVTSVYTDRNMSIFREPGVFVFFVNLALIFELFQKKKSFVKVIVFALAVVTSYSTTGYITIGIIFIAYLIGVKRIEIKHIAMMLFLVIAVCLVLLDSDTYSRVFSKIENTDNASIRSRQSSIFYNIELATSSLGSFLLGNGYSIVENSFVRAARTTFTVEGNNTNTMLKFFSVHGVVYLVIMFIGFIKFFLIQYDWKIAILITIAFFLMLSTEDFCLQILLYILVFYGYFTHDKAVKYI